MQPVYQVACVPSVIYPYAIPGITVYNKAITRVTQAKLYEVTFNFLIFYTSSCYSIGSFPTDILEQTMLLNEQRLQ